MSEAREAFGVETPKSSMRGVDSTGAHEMNAVPDLPAPSAPVAWVMIADWFNVLAGIFLMFAFLEGALINSYKWPPLLTDAGFPSKTALEWLQFLFSTEGVLYAVAEFFMIGIMAQTPPAFGGGSRGCMQFAILMLGGVFFAFSGLDFPGCIINITYLASSENCTAIPGLNSPFVWHAMAHYGITCFMVGTSIGFHGVLSAPKDKLISPYYGCMFYFTGAWTIGIFKFWGPVLAGGFSHEWNANAPALTWTSNWWFALLGAAQLTAGAAIFLIMNTQNRNTAPGM